MKLDPSCSGLPFAPGIPGLPCSPGFPEGNMEDVL